MKQTRETAPKVAACLDCGACETRCPYQLPIRKLLPEKMDALLKRLRSGASLKQQVFQYFTAQLIETESVASLALSWIS